MLVWLPESPDAGVASGRACTGVGGPSAPIDALERCAATGMAPKLPPVGAAAALRTVAPPSLTAQVPLPPGGMHTCSMAAHVPPPLCLPRHAHTHAGSACAAPFPSSTTRKSYKSSVGSSPSSDSSSSSAAGAAAEALDGGAPPLSAVTPSGAAVLPSSSASPCM
uniref:Uncharacterized protein n=1 Tax=Chlamydomonas euryale TaxID=1486919 RepID=A0A7R9YPX6_9CHLO